MTEEDQRKEIADSSIYTLIIMGNYRRADILLEENKENLSEPNYDLYNGVVQDKLERGLD